ncbi:F-box/LRR-repeat protein At2g43260 [Capsella rubella]|uniref:F-box/LRR-repeat protein At2g43260 n=1 Tax=Capsella rubella TaxID=81985 RepID=UPI000CD4EC26|nr:F-box/LRR-repeat protein At2g43260 [Capsella rubella]
MEVGNSNLNSNVLEELFLRLPLKSLGRFKSVSKEWKSILESKWFVERHLSLAKSRPNILLAYHCDCGVSTSILNGLQHFLWSLEFVYLHCDATRPSMSYDGLVCFPKAELVDVVNPSTGQLRRFHCPSLLNPCPNSAKFHEESWTTYFPGYCAMGFGRDSVKGCYKVVRIFRNPNYCDILDVNTGEWRKLWKPSRYKVDVGRKSTCVDGSIYWLRIHVSGSIYTILALDLHLEEFRAVPRPPLPKGIVFEAQIVNINDRLAIAMPVSHPLHQYELEIWSMDSHKETWSKTHSISLASLGMVEYSRDRHAP